jgi:hypothetical protein
MTIDALLIHLSVHHGVLDTAVIPDFDGAATEETAGRGERDRGPEASAVPPKQVILIVRWGKGGVGV